MRRCARLIGLGCVAALATMLAGCAKNGQFDPTDFFSSDMFDTKKPLKGERRPVFPEGVPGTESGVPPDLVKGYQPPPEQQPVQASAEPNAGPNANPNAAANPGAKSADATAVAEPVKPKPKPKPKPKVARAPSGDSIWDQPKPPTRIEVTRPGAPGAPAAPATASGQQGSPWPDPKPAAQTDQSVFPDPPGPGTVPR
jgi:hypothetical protein